MIPEVEKAMQAKEQARGIAEQAVTLLLKKREEIDQQLAALGYAEEKKRGRKARA